MKMGTLFMMAVALLAASAAASAAKSSGHYYTHTISQSKTVLPNGTTSVLMKYYLLESTDNVNNPLNNLAGNCTSNTIVSKTGKTLSANGICFAKDADGDSLPYWWTMDESGTPQCPTFCGSFRYLNGTGKFKGITGGGSLWNYTSSATMRLRRACSRTRTSCHRTGGSGNHLKRLEFQSRRLSSEGGKNQKIEEIGPDRYLIMGTKSDDRAPAMGW